MLLQRQHVYLLSKHDEERLPATAASERGGLHGNRRVQLQGKWHNVHLHGQCFRVCTDPGRSELPRDDPHGSLRRGKYPLRVPPSGRQRWGAWRSWRTQPGWTA